MPPSPDVAAELTAAVDWANSAPASYARPRALVGVDAGGTRTVAICLDLVRFDATIGEAGPANIDSEGLAKAVENIEAAVVQAVQDQRADHAVISVPGTGWRAARSAFSRAIPILDVYVTHDAVAAWAAVDLGSPAIAVISGTGSHAVGIDRCGVSAAAGGWGHIFGDEGSAYWLGREGVRAALMAIDGRGPATTLVQDLAVSGPLEDTVRRLYAEGATKSEVAAFARNVDHAASKGDSVARQLVQEAALALSKHVAAIMRRGTGFETVPIGLFGGVWASTALLTAFRATLRSDVEARVIRWPRAPVLGALALALHRVGRLDLSTPSHLDSLLR